VSKGFHKDSAHLALSDIRDSIEELSWYREHLLDPVALGDDDGVAGNGV
jgi:oligoribonuclease (3'-5' exoribonuclease)